MLVNVCAKIKAVIVVILISVTGVVVFGYNYKVTGNVFYSGSTLTPASFQSATQAHESSLSLPMATAFTPPGLGLAINSVQINSVNRALQVSFAVTNTDLEDMENVEVLLLDFTSEGKLDAVIGRKFGGGFKPAATHSLLLMGDVPSFYNHSILLTVRATERKYNVKEINMFELLTALLTLKSTGSLPSLAINNLSSEQVRYDSNFCHSVFRVAHNLNKAIPVTGYTCSQEHREFLISYHSELPRKI